jgi:hypothetical protein
MYYEKRNSLYFIATIGLLLIKKKMNNSTIKVRAKVNRLIKRSRVILVDQRGEGIISQAISILTAVVLGSLLLMGLYKLL